MGPHDQARHDRHDHLSRRRPEAHEHQASSGLKVEQAADLKAFTTEQTAAPKLAVLSPPNGQTLLDGTVSVAGSTDPGATVTVNGTAATVNPDGMWLVQLRGLPVGPTTLTVTATGKNGVTTNTTVGVSVNPPPPSDAAAFRSDHDDDHHGEGDEDRTRPR